MALLRLAAATVTPTGSNSLVSFWSAATGGVRIRQVFEDDGNGHPGDPYPNGYINLGATQTALPAVYVDTELDGVWRQVGGSRTQVDVSSVIPDGSIVTADLADGAVTAGKLADRSLPVVDAAHYGLLTASTPAARAAAIQAAIDAVVPSLMHAGIVDLGYGTLTVDATILLKPGVILRGNNPKGRTSGATVIKQADGANLDAVIASHTWYNNDVSSGSGYTAGVVGVCVDGNKANQTAGLGYGIVLSYYRSLVEGCVAMTTRGPGIALSSKMRDGTSEYPVGVNMAECRIVDNLVDSPDNHGIYTLEGSNGGKITDGFMLNNVVKGGTNSVYDGIYMGQSGGWLVSGNHTYSTGRGGIRVNGSDVVVTNNYCENYGRTAGQSGGVYGIDAQAYSGGVIIANNRVWVQGDQVGSGTLTHGVRIANGSGSNATGVVVGNKINMTTTTIASSIGLVISGTNGGGTLTLSKPGNSNTIVGFATNTSGSLTATASVESNIPGTWASAILGGRVASGKYVVPPLSSTGTANLTTPGVAYFVPVYLAFETAISAIGCSVSTASVATNGVMTLALYADNGTGCAPIASTAPIASGTVDSTSTGDKTVATSQTLKTGMYWLGILWTADAVTTPPGVVTATFVRVFGLDSLGNNSHRALSASGLGGLGALGSSFASSGTSPLLGLKVA